MQIILLSVWETEKVTFIAMHSVVRHYLEVVLTFYILSYLWPFSNWRTGTKCHFRQNLILHEIFPIFIKNTRLVNIKHNVFEDFCVNSRTHFQNGKLVVAHVNFFYQLVLSRKNTNMRVHIEKKPTCLFICWYKTIQYQCNNLNNNSK